MHYITIGGNGAEGTQDIPVHVLGPPVNLKLFQNKQFKKRIGSLVYESHCITALIF